MSWKKICSLISLSFAALAAFLFNSSYMLTNNIVAGLAPLLQNLSENEIFYFAKLIPIDDHRCRRRKSLISTTMRLRTIIMARTIR